MRWRKWLPLPPEAGEQFWICKSEECWSAYSSRTHSQSSVTSGAVAYLKNQEAGFGIQRKSRRERQMFGGHKRARVRGKEYATRSDFEQVFTKSMSGLHLLAFLLTADKQKAEECFVAGLEDSINGNPVFREWANSWSRRAIIKRAIAMVRPTPASEGRLQGSRAVPEADHPDCLNLAKSVTSLPPFSRFVFVMGVLEGYSTAECALLLNSTRHNVAAASAEAIRQVVSRCPGASDRVIALPSAWRAFFAAA